MSFPKILLDNPAHKRKNTTMLEKGLVQVYTGSGKGKTTAALGLAFRSAGQGNNVLFYQFLKPPSLKLGERISADAHTLHIDFKTIDLEWDMARSFRDHELLEQTKTAIHAALDEILDYAKKRQYDVIVLDEIIFCISKGLARFRDVKRILDERNRFVEIILTGRDASQELIEKADLVTEMRLIKHPYDRGIGPRKGIEY